MKTEPDPRQQRGLVIAATAKIVRRHGEWVVPSQTLNGKYVVKLTGGQPHCTCPDHETRRAKCKHIFAVEFVMRRESVGEFENVTAAVRVTYGQDWPAYNAAQTTEKEMFGRLLAEMCGTLPRPVPQRGNQPLPVGDALFAAAYKVYSMVSGRRFMTDMRNAQTAGLTRLAPSYNSIFKTLGRADMTPLIQRLIAASSLPLRAVETKFAIDSTGFGVLRFYRHYSAKYSHEQYSQDYLKLHAAVGVDTHVITAAEVTDRDRHDATQFKTLVERTAGDFGMTEILADKGYSGREAVGLVAGFGAEPFIPFRSNAKPDPSAPTWNRLYHFYNFRREEFLRCYHQRSNAESAFSSMKRKFGETLRSRTPTAQVNELLLKVLAHNIVCLVHSVHELGVDINFSQTA